MNIKIQTNHVTERESRILSFILLGKIVHKPFDIDPNSAKLKVKYFPHGWIIAFIKNLDTSFHLMRDANINRFYFKCIY